MVTISDRFLLAGAGAALCLAALGIWLLIAPPAATAPTRDAVAFAHDGSGEPDADLSSGSPAAASTETIVVDVEGAVRRPGIVRLAAGARVADAVAAAGGYRPDADLGAAAQLNLAARLTDGAQVVVPMQGDAGTGGAPVPGGSKASGRVDLNTATPEELDALPGIGPVTVQKIVAARQERPFASLDELVERKALSASQLAKIRDLVGVG
jgi:competence protein ComEA